MDIDLAEPGAVGKLEVVHLKRLWSRCIRERYGAMADRANEHEWALDNVLYHGLNIPIEDTIQYLYQVAPSFEEFEGWILQRNGGSIEPGDIQRINETIESLSSCKNARPGLSGSSKFLTADQLTFWDENGYLVVSGIWPDVDIKAAESAVWENLEMAPDDPGTWYRRKSDHGIMAQFFHHPALEAIRRSEKLTGVFSEIWGTSDLWVSTDRVSFNPPERPGFEFPGPRLHWDVSLEQPIPFGVQGLVYLTDTLPEQGAFTCVPGFHRRIEKWLNSLPAGTDPRSQDIDALGAVPISGEAGDLVIWHQALPHGSRPNRMDRPRIVQYVTMFPADAEYAKNWK